MARYTGGRRRRQRDLDASASNKEEGIELDGTIEENLPNALFRVHLPEMEKSVIAHVSGKMRKNWIRLMAGDRVRVQFSPYDLDRARIVQRYR